MNNNAVICKDTKGRDLVAFGIGIGFPKVPYELDDLSKVQHTFYNISEQYISMIDTIDYEIIEFTADIVDMISVWQSHEMSPNLLLTLADHISFAIERKKKGIYIRMPLIYDVEQIYEEEIQVARKIINKIWIRFHIQLPDSEVVGIAMNLVNARIYDKEEAVSETDDDVIIAKITEIVEKEMHVIIEANTFNYSRYVTHIQYLIQRLRQNKCIDSINQEIYETMRADYPQVDHCVGKIAQYLQTKCKFKLAEEEKLYLMLHINRICSKEGL